MYYAHDNRITCLEVSPDGTAVGTGSWDNTLRVSWGLISLEPQSVENWVDMLKLLLGKYLLDM